MTDNINSQMSLGSESEVIGSRPPMSLPSSISSSKSDLSGSGSVSDAMGSSSSSGFLSCIPLGSRSSMSKSKSRSSVMRSFDTDEGETTATEYDLAIDTNTSYLKEETREEIEQRIKNLNNFNLEPITDQDWDLELSLNEYRPMTRSEVWAHSQNGDILVIRFGEVLNLASLFVQVLKEGENRRKRLSPIYKYNGKDVSHWFDPLTEDPRTRVDLRTGKKVIFAPDGPYYGLYTYEKRVQEAKGDSGLPRPSATFFESFMMSSILIEREAEGIFDEHPNSEKNNSQLEKEIVSRLSIRNSKADYSTPASSDSPNNSNINEQSSSDDHGGNLHSDGDIPNEQAIRSSKRHLNMSPMMASTFSDEFDNKSFSESKEQKEANKENTNSAGEIVKYDGPVDNFKEHDDEDGPSPPGRNFHSDDNLKIRPSKRNIQVSQLFSGSLDGKKDQLLGGRDSKSTNISDSDGKSGQESPSSDKTEAEADPDQENILEGSDSDSNSDENKRTHKYDGPLEDFRAHDDDDDTEETQDTEDTEDSSGQDGSGQDGPGQSQDGPGANYHDDTEISEDLQLKPSKRNLQMSHFDEFKDDEDDIQDQDKEDGDSKMEEDEEKSNEAEVDGGTAEDDDDISEDLKIKPSKRSFFTNFDEFEEENAQENDDGEQNDGDGDNGEEESQNESESEENDQFQGPEEDFKENDDDDDQENDAQSVIFGANFHSDEEIPEDLKIRPSKRNLILPKFDEDIEEDSNVLETIKPVAHHDGSDLKKGFSSSEGLVVTSDEIPGPKSHLNELSNERLIKVRPSKRNINLNNDLNQPRRSVNENLADDDQVKKVPSSGSVSAASERSSQRSTDSSSIQSSQSQASGEQKHVPRPSRAFQDLDYDEEMGKLWWRNSKLVVGYVPEQTFFVRIINTLNGDQKLLEACRESTINDLLRAYLAHNSRAVNYLWKDIYGNVLHPHKKLSENGLMDNSEVCEMGLEHFPVILLHFKDGFEFEPKMNFALSSDPNQCLNLPCRTY